MAQNRSSAVMQLRGEGNDISDCLPQGPFGCILADPPWSFLTYGKTRITPHRCVEDHYRTMTFDHLAALPVQDIAAKHAALFMWIVDSHFEEALALGKSWGFTFKTIAFIWLKETINGRQLDIFRGESEPRISMGYWTRKQAEICLLFTRGKPKRQSKAVRQVIRDPRREHSRKPDQQYERIEALVQGPYLELFARQSQPGWTSWGNEVDRFDG